MDATLIAAVLLAALLHASWNALVKIGGDGLLTLFLFKVLTCPIAVVVLMFTGLPDLASLPYAIASGVTTLFYFVFLGFAYQRADFSLVYPVARGVAPPAVAILAMVFAGEVLKFSTIIGTGVVSAGLLVLAYMRRPETSVFWGLTSAFGVGLTIAAYTLIDGMGARVSRDAIAYAALVNLASFLPLCALVLVRRRRQALDLVTREWRRGLIGGCIMSLAYGIVIYAMAHAPLASVASLRETSVIFAALIGTRMLNEPFGLRRFIAACIVTAGVAIIIFGRN